MTICKSNGFLPTQRTINSISVLINTLSTMGVSAESILEGSGIAVSDLKDPEKWIRTDQELYILRRVLKLTSVPEIGLLLGGNYHVGIQGYTGIVAMFCQTFMDAVEIAMKYAEVSLTYFRYELKINGRKAFICMDEIMDLFNLRQIISEREFVSVFRMCSDILGKTFPMIEVHIAYPEPSYGWHYTNYFQCPVVFGSGTNALIFDRKVLKHRLPKANPLMKKVYEKELNRIYKQMKNSGSMRDKIFNRLSYSTNFLGTMDDIARELNISSRTLRRKLADEGTTYRDIVSEVRLKKAVELLESSDSTIEEIAVFLGYSDTPNFYHAFKKWTGTTPAEFRK